MYTHFQLSGSSAPTCEGLEKCFPGEGFVADPLSYRGNRGAPMDVERALRRARKARTDDAPLNLPPPPATYLIIRLKVQINQTSKRGSKAAGLSSLSPSPSPSCGFCHSPRALFFPPGVLFFRFPQPNSADNRSADTAVGKITALHFSSLSPFPLHLSGLKGGRDGNISLKKKGERNGEWSV